MMEALQSLIEPEIPSKGGITPMSLKRCTVIVAASPKAMPWLRRDVREGRPLYP